MSKADRREFVNRAIYKLRFPFVLYADYSSSGKLLDKPIRYPVQGWKDANLWVEKGNPYVAWQVKL